MAQTYRDDQPLRRPVAGEVQQRGRGLLAPGPLPDEADDFDDDPDDDAPVAPREASPARWWWRAASFGREHAAVLAVALVVGVVFGVMTFLRARPDQVPLTSASSAVAASAQPSPDPTPTPIPTIKVHVLGAVANPGVVTLPAGSRVQDAIAAAGGLTPDADPAELNLAAVLADGSQIIIGTVQDPQGQVNGGGGGSGPGAVAGATSLVNLNTATLAELETLPGVGPVTAQKIITWRQQNGKFSSVSELQEVDGIGPKTFAQIEPYVCV